MVTRLLNHLCHLVIIFITVFCAFCRFLAQKPQFLTHFWRYKSVLRKNFCSYLKYCYSRCIISPKQNSWDGLIVLIHFYCVWVTAVNYFQQWQQIVIDDRFKSDCPLRLIISDPREIFEGKGAHSTCQHVLFTLDDRLFIWKKNCTTYKLRQGLGVSKWNLSFRTRDVLFLFNLRF
jgi:hypothetical protein